MPTQYRMMKYYDPGETGSIWQRTEDSLPELNDGQVAVRLDWLSIDPGMMGWVTNKRSYMPPVQPGEVMRAFGVGEVTESNSSVLSAGDFVTGFTGVQTEGIFSAKALRKIDTSKAPAHEYLSGLGMTGYTAYFGMMDIGQPKAEQTVVVSAASGAVGSIAAQLARNAGARVIGIAGGAEKAAYLQDTLKLTGAIDYKAGGVDEQMRELAPDGIDIYFDNVGGEILDTALRAINYQGTIVLCGGVSQYGNMYEATGPKEYLQMVMQSIRMQGFTMRDYMHRVPEAIEHLYQARAEGNLVFREHILEGIGKFPDAFKMLFAGENHGKLMLKL